MSSTAKSSSLSSKQQQQRWKDEKYDKQARAFRLDMDCRHRQYLHQTHQQQQERHHNNSKRNDMSTTRVRERAEARAGGGGGGEEPRDRPPVSCNNHIKKITKTNGSVVVSNLRRRTSIRRVTNGNKDGSTNSNKAHTVPFRIEIPSSSCLYLVSSEEYSEVTIDDDSDDDDADVRDPPLLMVQQHRLSYDDDDTLRKQGKEQMSLPSDEDRSEWS